MQRTICDDCGDPDVEAGPVNGVYVGHDMRVTVEGPPGLGGDPHGVRDLCRWCLTKRLRAVFEEREKSEQTAREAPHHG